MLELAGSASAPRSASSAAASLHTASRLQRSARTASSTRARRARTKPPRRASAPAPFAVFVRFQFVVIVFAFLRFPAVVFRSLLRSGVRVPDRLLRAAFRPPFERVQVSENRVRPEVRSGAVCRPDRPVPSPSAPPAPLPQSSGSVRPAGPAAVRGSGLPPGSGLLFRSFAVRFVHGSYLSSFCVRFSSVRLFLLQLVSASSCSVRSCSFPFVLPFRSFLLVLFGFPVRFELVPLCLRPLTGDLFIYFPRILYTECNDFQMYFLAKNMCFLEIMAHFRKKYP